MIFRTGGGFAGFVSAHFENAECPGRGKHPHSGNQSSAEEDIGCQETEGLKPHIRSLPFISKLF